jgi:hypothetical protein
MRFPSYQTLNIEQTDGVANLPHRDDGQEVFVDEPVAGPTHDDRHDAAQNVREGGNQTVLRDVEVKDVFHVRGDLVELRVVTPRIARRAEIIQTREIKKWESLNCLGRVFSILGFYQIRIAQNGPDL